MPRLILLMLLLPARTIGGQEPYAAFQSALDSLARANHMPGYSAVIVREGAVVWRHGFGFAEIERRTPATPATPYRLASVTKPIAATILMQLTEEGRLDLDAPMADFPLHAWFEPTNESWAHFPSRYASKTITVRHVLTHTSQSDPPGEAYRYNGNIFGDLTWVIEGITRRSYPRVVQERILDRVGMSRTAAGHMAPWSQAFVREIAVPYNVKGDTVARGTYPGFGIEHDADVTPWNLNPAFRTPARTDSARRALLGPGYTPLYSAQTAAGMVSTVEDLAKFDIALDAGRLVSAESRRQMFTASARRDGTPLPYGLGWFVEQVDGRKAVWHYGWFPPTVSALYFKLPEQQLTFIMLSNSDLLSARMSWTAQGIRASPYARLFLERVAASN